MQLFVKFAEAGVIVAPGWIFAADTESPPEPGSGHFRISFSNADVSISNTVVVVFTDFPPLQLPTFKKVVKIFGQVLREFHQQ